MTNKMFAGITAFALIFASLGMSSLVHSKTAPAQDDISQNGSGGSTVTTGGSGGSNGGGTTSAAPILTSAAKAYLSEAAGGASTENMFKRSTAQCNFYEKTQYRRRNSSFEKDVCIQSAPSNGALDLGTAKFAITDNNECSFQGPLRLGRGTNTQIISEIDRIYGRAYEIAVKKGDKEASIKIGQAREYAKSLTSVIATTDTVYGHIRANGKGWPFGTSGICGGSLSVDYIQLLPG